MPRLTPVTARTYPVTQTGTRSGQFRSLHRHIGFPRNRRYAFSALILLAAAAAPHPGAYASIHPDHGRLARAFAITSSCVGGTSVCQLRHMGVRILYGRPEPSVEK